MVLASPVQCLGLLGFLAAAGVISALWLPQARAIFLPPRYPEADRLVLVSRGGNPVSELPTTSAASYRLLADHRQGRFSGIAFYRRLDAPAGLRLAVASANLFPVLGISMPSPGTLVLSHRAWSRYFHRDPHIAGKSVTLAGETAVVAGVLPADAWRLPGKFDAWLLADDRAAAAGRGFVLGRLSGRPSGSWWNSRPVVPVSVPNGDGGVSRFECFLLANAIPPLLVHVWILAVGLLIASISTSFSLGEYRGGAHAISLGTRSRRWIFLAAKIALLLPIVVCLSMDLGAAVSPGLALDGLILGYVVGFRWALADQRNRCPVCLRLLTSPTRIGGASHAFLAWYGTELICGRGHGLLHVPEIRTSSYWTQRWVYLDSSWSELFSGIPR
jgi:hypothetical protein